VRRVLQELRRKLPGGLLLLAAAALLLWLPAGPWRVLLAATAWLLLPALLLLVPLPARGVSRLELAVLAAGLSLSLLSLLGLWAALWQLNLNRLFDLLPFTALVLLWLRLPRQAWRLQRSQLPLAAGWLLVLTATALLRAVQIDGLALPAWVDAPQHALLVRAAAEQGRAPLDLRPYLAVSELPYHWGYHLWQAQVWRSGGAALSDTLLWSGQLLNWLLVPASGALALTLFRRPWAALLTALIVGLVSTMPAYYVSWSRYTQLAGLLLLPAPLIALRGWQRTQQRRWWLFALLLFAGLLLVHVRVLIFALLLFVVQLALMLQQRRRRRQLAAAWRPLAAAALSVTALLLPWLRILLQQRLAPALSGSAPLSGGPAYTDLTPGLLWAGPNELLLPAAGLAALWLLWAAPHHTRRAGAALLIWLLLLLLVTLPQLLGWLAPAAGLAAAGLALQRRRWRLLLPAVLLCALNPWTLPLRPLWLLPVDILLISLFLPAALLIAAAVTRLHERLPTVRLRATLPVLLLAGGLAAGWVQRSIVNPQTVLADADDRAALAWIAAQTPADARFLVNAAGWMPAVPRLNDGGGWITPLTGRWASLPPITFVYADAAVQAQVRSAAALVRAAAPGRLAALDAYLTTADIDYVYTSARGPLTPQLLYPLERLWPVFQQGDVVIYHVEAWQP
jgi:hypothetical protein